MLLSVMPGVCARAEETAIPKVMNSSTARKEKQTALDP
jgi:hypothetical protein